MEIERAYDPSPLLQKPAKSYSGIILNTAPQRMCPETFSVIQTISFPQDEALGYPQIKPGRPFRRAAHNLYPSIGKFK
ncbi:MAG: hypothetical protein A2900_04535 [Candidatus Chisholmbacteria bacterium RIFCSPLOWO2_01_FULL_50_28]|uniref:Uncharacterized protein n=1 Tax=Candidatus Chisholmbacteria bacterium RIFCSPHIGHO2_01_FULL_52_32 TaxID=1797591 RepID=A0A1G1VSG9_9BACT|nr:MAG: hypothetical protein A2786_02210 [Candidatus Chisholmbacteria bacterium RIFCSPHIGHO2_01_FULL_52_32]OGY20318.1 MAG: hypothetical protein A2900_04535 [Candidatus Chisholmbacteria bacterium RIFCSPLOWO2_01_FULL_50_28]